VQQKLKELEVQCFSHYLALHSSPAGLKFGRASGELAIADMASTHLVREKKSQGFREALSSLCSDCVDVHLEVHALRALCLIG
jgi:hypothetical protein